MLGNDVVDLRDADSRPESFRPRFDARVYADPERRAIARDSRPLVRRWAHWAAKEAAYKLARQLDPGFVFAPKRLVACFEPPAPAAAAGRRSVRCGRLALPVVAGMVGAAVELKSFETPEWVHVIALPAGADWDAVESAVELRGNGAGAAGAHGASGAVGAVGAGGGHGSRGVGSAYGVDDADAGAEDASLAVRRLARREVGRSLALPEARLSIGRRGRIPVLELDGQPTSLALSLSHHGRWIAYAMTPRVDAVSPWIGAGRPPASGGADRAGAGNGNGNGNGPGATTWQTL